MSTLRPGNAAPTLARNGEQDKVIVEHPHRAAISCEAIHDEQIHELRAALFGIEASAQGLRLHRDQLTAPQVDALVEALVAEARRLRTLLDARMAVLSDFDLGDAIGPVITCARASGQDVRSSVPRGLDVYGARESTAQVMVALLDNARKHAPSSPVELRAAVTTRGIVLYVDDRGTGISGPSHERVFERGVCGDDSAGCGLGLFVARRLMAEQGGSITVHNRSGGGTSFVLRFRHPR
jgi:signal transduction histidine kinase